MKSFWLSLFSLIAISLNGVAQLSLDVSNNWVQIGPDRGPTNPKFRGDAGIGPIEFIRVNRKREGYLLAGSLSGGLFFSNSGGDSWVNAGSDDWTYSGCAWADFHPEDVDTWFACSNFSDNNGKPGSIEKGGGLLRTRDGGKDWDRIGDFNDFGGSKYIRIYGTRFHPEDPDKLFVLTSEGLYYTESCMAEFVRWNRVPQVKGWVYDLDFLDGKMYLSNFFHGKWSILQFNQDNYSAFKKVADLHKDPQPMRNVTIEPRDNGLLIVKDYTKISDELHEYMPEDNTTKLLLDNQKINYGSGYTFAVSPHNPNYFYLGYSTRIRKWHYPAMKSKQVGTKYHIDIEFVAYDPFDSLKIYFATHGGVFISENNGIDWENKSNGIGVAEVMGLAVSESDPNLIAIGCYHDGSMLYAKHDDTSKISYWRTVNGGDGLIPIIDPNNNAVVYTSNQFTGGGLYYSLDTAKRNRNIHHLNNLKTSGWEMAAVLHPENPNTLFFNFVENDADNKGNINVCRTSSVTERRSAEKISDFLKSHKLKKYKVYGLFNSKAYPNELYAYVLHYATDETGKKITLHKLFRCEDASKPAEEVINSWYEVRHPSNTWIADVIIDPDNENRLFLSYTKGKDNPESIFGDRGMIYSLKYQDTPPFRLKKEYDITKNIPNSVAGRFNMVYVDDHGGGLLIATRTGVYFGRSDVLKGKARWIKIGEGLPHCKVYGLDYNEKEDVITVAYFGRGVWQYYF